MKNTIISEEEVNKVLEIYNHVEELVEIHAKNSPNFSEEVSHVEKIHTSVYLDMLGDFVKSAKCLHDLFEISEEDFVQIITDNGKISVEEALSSVMFKCLMDIIK